MHTVMPEQDPELKLLEKDEAAPAAVEETPGEAQEVPVAAVSRVEFEQLKGERDQLVDRLLDNFELALKSDGTPEQLRSGVELIVKQMQDILRQMQVHAVLALGEEFDPRQHEALGSVERADLPDQHVAEEIRRGYRIRERLLRPALVRVVSNPKQTSD